MKVAAFVFVVLAVAMLQSQQAPPRTEWLKTGGSFFNQNYSPLTQINRDTVATVKGVWRTHLNSSGAGARYSGEAQPVVQDGTIYIVTGADDVFALSVKTGRILWNYSAGLPDAIPTVCCGWTSRGVAIGDGRVYVGQLDGRLMALDQQTGSVAWSIQAERWQNGYTITAAPLYYDGKVIVGFAGGENGTRGRVKAFDAKDGHLIWTFYTVPGPGEFGHETWPQGSDAWLHGGGTVWQTPALDPDLGLIIFTTGNPGPDFNGKIRAGDNLFTTSMVAIDATTGKYRWHFQQIHHDLWDYDGPSPVVLFDVMINGTLRKAAAEPNKAGWVYIVDRTNGKPLIGIDEKPVPQEPRQATSKTQPIPRGDAFVPQSVDIAPEDYALVNQGRIFTPFWKEPSADHAGRSALPWQRFRRRAAARNGHLLGARHEDQQAGVAAALEGFVLQRFGDDGRRTGVHRPQRWTTDRAELRQRQTPLGISDGRRDELAGERLRIRRRRICRRLFSRKSLRGNGEGRQRLAVLDEGNAVRR
ncbi:MAG: hypothetical protein DMF87_08355 [Acidobacteria bacterium]|nr:MAG: hypothetical protein DMF87_08355 [Acidobacteriota bacterium]